MAYKLKTTKPLKLRQNKLPLQFSIVVPSTKNNVEISQSSFLERIDDEKKWISKKFGGDTSIRALGSYILKKGKNEKLIKEDVAIVEASTTPKIFEEQKKYLEIHIKDRKKEWKQYQIMYKIEGNSFLYPKKRQYPSDNSVKEIPIT